MSNDVDILAKALRFEQTRAPMAWGAMDVDASQMDINRLKTGGFIDQRHRSSNLGNGQYGPALYKLTDKGRETATAPSVLVDNVSAADMLQAMSLIVGFDDIKETVAYAIQNRNKVHKQLHFLFEGPPASAKSILMEAVREVVPNAQMIFGSRTSASGLSDLLFERKPSVLLADEIEKMHQDAIAVLLGLMEHEEILETKHQGTRGLKLKCMVIAACNSSKKLPPEFLSRFAFHPKLPHYSRDEFVDVVRSMLSRAEECPPELAEMIAAQVYDSNLGDVRQARGVWQLMREPTEAEAIRVLRMKAKYSTSTGERPLVTRKLEGRLV